MEGDRLLQFLTFYQVYFYPRPPGGGRPSSAISNILSGVFLSTPSGWRATRSILSGSKVSVFLSTPSGWRATSALQPQCTFTVFLSTPSGGRATKNPRKSRKAAEEFLSTPSGWRATWEIAAAMKMYNISIHALRVEGDIFHSSIHRAGAISIHALRVEGDRAKLEQIEVLANISIHALRVEGDLYCYYNESLRCTFLSTPSGWRATHAFLAW